MTSIHTRESLGEAVFFEGDEASQKYTKFWMLLILAAIIAAAGVVAESEATVIGAMIVAPLRIPVLGTMLGVVLRDRRNLLRCVFLLVAGSCLAVAVGYLVGLSVVNEEVTGNNSQVLAWSQPGLIDLLAALAIGVVGSVALLRKDINDALPGVAIAVSLVPPLVVVGLTLEAGAPKVAYGALLLFLTNVAAILAAGAVVMGIYHVPRRVLSDTSIAPGEHPRGYVVIGVLLVIVGGLLARGSIQATQDLRRESNVAAVASDWSGDVGWELVDVSTRNGKVVARFEGPPPLPGVSEFRSALVDAGVDPADVQAELVPKQTVDVDDPDAA